MNTDKNGRSFDERVSAQLDLIVASKPFRQSERLKKFLTFVVNETLAGRGERLKEFVVGVEVFGKDSRFDPRNDPLVRVQARRLRAQLARYYSEDGQTDETVIELPKGGYTPTFRGSKAVSSRRTLPSAIVSRNTVAVIPFADYTRAGDQEYFCQGIALEIGQMVGEISAIRLVAWPRTKPFDGDDDLRRAAERLGVSLVVSGGVRVANGERRITMYLLDASSGTQLWSESINRAESEDLEAQEDVAKRVAAKLRETVATSGHAHGGGNSTDNLAACNLCMQGRYHLNQRTEESLRKAVDFFERATAEDAQYASAYSGLADAWGLLAHYGAIAPVEALTKAGSNVAWAVMMNENSAEAHTSLAHIKATHDWDWEVAEREFRRALDLDPRYATARHWYAMACLVPLGRLSEALNEMLIARELDPISSIIARDVAAIHYYRRDYEAALEQCDRTIELNPHFSPGYWMLGLVQEQMGDLDESAAALQRAVELTPHSVRMHAALGRLFALSGRDREARAILKQLRGQSQSRYVSPFDLASICVGLGLVEEGLELLGRAAADRSFELTFAQVDPRLDVLRGDGRFGELVSQIGVVAAWA